MINWIKFFFLSYFSNEKAKEGVKRGFANVFLSLILAMIFLCLGLIGADALPFGVHYDNASEFKTTVRNALCEPSSVNGISVEIQNGKLKAGKGENLENALIVDTFNNEQDKKVYATKGYHLVIDTRPADTLASVEAYCVSTSDNSQVISYADYLTLNEVARQNYEFKLKYTGSELILTDAMVESFKTYINSTDNETAKTSALELLGKLADGKVTKVEYNRKIYELYFELYYPKITTYESTSKVPLLRNYYFHEIIDGGENRFLMLFDDCLVGSFATDNNIEVFFYGFYNSVENGKLIEGYFDASTKINAVDNLIKKSYSATADLSAYVYVMNTIRIFPMIALMVIVVTMLTHSILALNGVKTCKTFGSTIKVIGSFLWFSGVVAAILTIITAFFVQRGLITVVTIISLFLALLVRAIFFIISEIKNKPNSEEELTQTEQEETANY